MTMSQNTANFTSSQRAKKTASIGMPPGADAGQVPVAALHCGDFLVWENPIQGFDVLHGGREPQELVDVLAELLGSLRHVEVAVLAEREGLADT